MCVYFRLSVSRAVGVLHTWLVSTYWSLKQWRHVRFLKSSASGHLVQQRIQCQQQMNITKGQSHGKRFHDRMSAYETAHYILLLSLYRVNICSLLYRLTSYLPHNALFPDFHKQLKQCFWLPAQWAFEFSGDHQQNHQCLWYPCCCVCIHVNCFTLFVIG